MRFRRSSVRLMFALSISLLACISNNGQAIPKVFRRSPGDRAGVQMLLLPFWSSSSVTNFLNVFRDSQGGYTAGPHKLAVSFCPYLYYPADSYRNIHTVLNALISGGKDISVTVFLDRSDLHNHGTGADHDIETSASDFYKNFLKAYAGKVEISVCPSLEDYASPADIDRWANEIATQIVDTRYRSYLTFHRNPDAGYGTYLPAKGSYHAVELELHGPARLEYLAGEAYSNDGIFVGSSNETMTTDQVSNQAPDYSISSFAEAIKSRRYTGTVLLWRPAYNLFKRKTVNGKTNFDRTKRDLSDVQTSFDSTEAQVLTDFFGS